MSVTEVSAIRVRVDPANPGQFLACCGLLELADRLWNGAEGWFEGDEFAVSSRGSLDGLLQILADGEPAELTRLDNGLEVKPLIAPLRIPLPGLEPLVLDAWMQLKVDQVDIVAAANPPWNFWAGQQTPLRIWAPLRKALRGQMAQVDWRADRDLFSRTVPVSGRFGFDPGAAWAALDVGFSPDAQDVKVASCPAVELLAAIGVQRFRPTFTNSRFSFVYATWGVPVPPAVASLAACDAIKLPPRQVFRGRVVRRGSGYSALGYSSPFNGGDHV